VIALSLALAALGKLSNISDIVAYGIIVWVYGILLVSFGWKVGWLFWPPVLHLVYMLPLPARSTTSSRPGCSSSRPNWASGSCASCRCPVFLEGNIIDLGVYKLHVAEACSGLRYLFPILSFSYIFAVLYKGPMWHKAVLLISAAPITVLMNSVRIAVAGYIVNHYGIEWVEGFTHFFEGWVIFLICIVILFALARLMLFLQPTKMSLAEALDLETEGLATAGRPHPHVEPSPAMITTAALTVALSLAFLAVPGPHRGPQHRTRPLHLLPARDRDWRQTGPAEILDASSLPGRLARTTTTPSSCRTGPPRPRSGSSWPGMPTSRRAACIRPRSACPAADGRSPGSNGRTSPNASALTVRST
jgi:exosortase D (VPLPA-CTERM-specific)